MADPGSMAEGLDKDKDKDMDPSEFVQHIRQLGAQRDQQDLDRVRRLEEELIKGKSERMARRAERARSISPDKPSTPQATTTPAPTTASTASTASTPTPAPTMSPPPSDDTEPAEPKKATSAAALGRSGTLSWKQRPQSGSGRRPLSMAAPSSSRDTSEPASPERSPSRSSIAHSLGAKDPAWFRQTPDRGVGSAAYRRTQDDTASETGSISSKRQLPGMSRESTVDAGTASPPPDSTRSPSPSSRGGSVRNSTVLSNRFSSNTSLSGGDAELPAQTRSPMPTLDSQKFAPPSEPDTPDSPPSSVRALAMSPTQGRISPERERPTTPNRPASPTKGMGGFVQSAMLKRSDSVSKRWSTQTPPVLNRQNSTLSSRGSVAGALGTLPKMERPNSLTRDNSPETSSRPTSSASNLTITKGLEKDATPKDEFVKPALPHRHSRSKSVASTFSEHGQPQDDDAPPSPSKRWSPNKSSWLESALNKPESPKVKQQAPPAQPAWMAEINRIKQQRSSVDLGKGSLSGRSSPVKDLASGRSSPIKDLASGRSSPIKDSGSGRTSPIKDFQLKPTSARNFEFPKREEALKTLEEVAKKPEEMPQKSEETPKKPEKLADPFSSPKPVLAPKPAVGKDDVKELDKAAPEPEPVTLQTPALGEQKVEEPSREVSPAKDTTPLSIQVPEPTPEQTSTSTLTPTPTSAKLGGSRFARDSPRTVPVVKPKPTTPPKKDFRAGLRSRQLTNDMPKTPGQGVSELQNVFGKLRRAETKNYVAPDPLKDNILRGKEALNVTGGPKPTVRRDEFRQSLIVTKSAMLEKAKESGSTLKRSDSISQPVETPEAIAAREKLARAESTPRAPSPQKQQSTPEAIARKKSLRTNVRPVIEGLPPTPAPLFAAKEPAKAGKLANRFNPALAGILARGPPPLATSNSPPNGSSITSPQEEKTGPAPELQHMTKGRARGPKRRAPRAAKEAPAEAENAPEKVTTTAAVPLAKPARVLSSSESPKADGLPEELPVKNVVARQSLTEKPATPAKSPRVASGAFAKPSPELPRKPSIVDLSRRVSGLQGPPPKSPRPDSIGSPKLSSPGIPKKPSSIELSRRASGLQLESAVPSRPSTPEVSKKPSSIELSKRVSGLQLESAVTSRPSTPEISKKPSSIELSRRVSGLQSESAASPRPSTPEISKKPSSIELSRRVSGLQLESVAPPRPSTPDISKKPSSIELSRRASGLQSESAASPRPSTPEISKKPSSIELSRRVSGLQLGSVALPRPSTPDISKKPSSIELSKRVSGLQLESVASPRPSTPDISKKPSSIELSRRVSGLQLESVAPPRPSTPDISKKPSSPALDKRISSAQSTPQRPASPAPSIAPKPSSPAISVMSKPSTPSPIVNASAKPSISSTTNTPSKPTTWSPIMNTSAKSSISSISNTPSKLSFSSSAVGVFAKSASASPTASIASKQASPPLSASSKFQSDSKPASPSPTFSSRFSRPLPTLPPKPSAGSPKPTIITGTTSFAAETSPVKTELSPQTPIVNVKNATSMWGKQPSPISKGKFPIKLPTRADERAAMQDAGLVRSPEPAPRPEPIQSKPLPPKPLEPKPKPAGLGFMGGLGSLVTARSRESSPQLSKDLPASPPLSADRPLSEPFKSMLSPERPPGMFAEFFDEAPVTEGQLADHIDTVHILKSPPLDLGLGGKIRTVRKEMLRLTGDGRLSPVPVQEEHVLFHESMYLCTHVYGDAKGVKHTDVYLWAGNSVAESILEDAQLFAKSHARHQQGRLLVIRQGHETPNFFEALGGILMTRRGSQPTSGEFMLCGRRHLGHLAFDEVDFSLKSLCSAFPYLISTKTGKVFLWKGRGCSAEELSGARLMGMDLAPTGDFHEIDEGSEPESLVSIFPPSLVPNKGPAIPRSADHWRYKATTDRYRVRLFKMEQQPQESLGWGHTSLQVSSSFFGMLRRPSWGPSPSPSSTGPQTELGPQAPLTPKSPRNGPVVTKVVEVMPFCQRDLEPENIYVLDAFFEMYIIVGPLSRTQAPAFSTALLFAQEYGILAVSEEDRPFMPFTNVVLEGVPRDMKAIFRHWDDRLIPAAGLMSGKLGRGKSLRIVGLEKAIEGTRR